MLKFRLFGLLVPALLVSGCQTPPQTLGNDQEIAAQTALRRAQFELGCPTATASVLSGNLLQPIAWGGQERAEYTVGITGCGQRATYIVVCPQQSPGCFAARGRS